MSKKIWHCRIKDNNSKQKALWWNHIAKLITKWRKKLFTIILIFTSDHMRWLWFLYSSNESAVLLQKILFDNLIRKWVIKKWRSTVKIQQFRVDLFMVHRKMLKILALACRINDTGIKANNCAVNVCPVVVSHNNNKVIELQL